MPALGGRITIHQHLGRSQTLSVLMAKTKLEHTAILAMLATGDPRYRPANAGQGLH